MRKKLPRYFRLGFSFLSFFLSFFSFTVFAKYLFFWPALQAGPNFVRFFAVFSMTSLLILAILFLSTFIFGRFYCAALCPFGILQDLILFLIPKKLGKKSANAGNYPRVRYPVALFVFCVMAGGFSLVFAILDPYSNFGRIASTLFNPIFIGIYNQVFPFDGLSYPITDPGWILFGALLPFIFLIGLVLWKRRIFCTAICPVGTLLGLFSKYGLMRLEISSGKCTGCKRCVRECPAGCIEIGKEKTLDPERCLLCMNCMAYCPEDAFRYGFSKRSPRHGAAWNPSRRKFVAGSAALAVAGIGTGLYAGGFRQRLGKEIEPSIICPPGAGSPQRFLAYCTDCNLCIPVCEGHVIKPAGIGSKVVHLDFEQGVCEFHCRRCTEVCPTDALLPMGLREKQLLRIGMAEVHLPFCVVIKDGTDCGACSEVCPTGALVMEANVFGKRIPVLYPDFCIGCGGCAHACPAHPNRAMRVHPVSVQVSAEDPKARMGREMIDGQGGEKIIQTDEWLF